MALERLRIEALRCLSDIDIALDPGRNYVIGPNGAGKTSLLESVYLLGRGRSFRTRQTARLVQRGRPGLTVHGTIRRASGVTGLGVGFADRRLSVRIGGIEGHGTASLARELAVYVIDPKLHELVEAGPSERRRFVDWGVFHVEHGYLADWRSYRRLLGQRNAALKHGAGGAELDAWTEPLVAAGERITAARERYVAGLARSLNDTGTRLLGRAVAAGYARGWRRDVGLAEALAEAAERERELGATPVGPHRADLRLGLDGNEVRDEASRGQQKLIVAALVLAQIDALEGAAEVPRILLVDDPAAELDSAAFERLMAEIVRRPCQLIVTGLSAQALDVPADARTFHVEQGRIRSMV